MYYCSSDLYKVLVNIIFVEGPVYCVYYKYSNTELVICYEVSYEGQ